MTIVNQVYKRLEHFNIQQSTSMESQNYFFPRMRTFRHHGTVIIFFPGGTIRLMGRVNNSFIKKVLDEMKITTGTWQLQTRTITYRLPGSIDLLKCAKQERCVYEPELFCALGIYVDNERINIFYSGNCILFGKSFNLQKKLLFLDNLYLKYKI